MADPEIPEEIKAQSTDRLLTLFAQLTHKIHAAQAVQAGLVQDGDYETARRGEANLRDQRQVVKREILHRCGEI